MQIEQIDPKRSALMARIRGKDTKPEMAVRRLAHAMGYRFRLHRRDLPGRPDLVFPKYRAVMFVHGCFWHQHADCRAGVSVPKTRREFWVPKLAGNVARDARSLAALEELGWRAGVIWECEIKRPEFVRDALADLLRAVH